MTTATPQPTHAELREALVLDLENRRAALHAGIDRDQQEIGRLHGVARQHSEWGQQIAAQQAQADAKQKTRDIDTARAALRALDDERDRLDRGSDPRLSESASLQAERMQTLTAQQSDYRAAMAAFAALRTAELLSAAQRVVQAAQAMQFEPPALAVAIVSEARRSTAHAG